MKKVQKIQVCSLLYIYGFSFEEIDKYKDISVDSKDIVKYLRLNKLKRLFQEKASKVDWSLEDFELLKSLGQDSILEDIVEKKEDIPFDLQLLKTDIEMPIAKSERKSYEDAVRFIKSLVSKPDINNVCSVCENLGVVYLPKKDGSLGVTSHTCPKCKGDSVKRTLGDIEVSKDVLKEYINNPRYLSEDFDVDVLNKTVRLSEDVKEKTIFNNYLDELEKTLNVFKSGNLPTQSLLLSAPDGFGKKFFIYQCIKETLKNGYTPSKLLNILEINQLVNNYKYDEITAIFDVDILFLDMVGNMKINPRVFSFILMTCETKGIPVIISSRLESRKIINQRYDDVLLDWLDIFTDIEKPYDYGHLRNIGITGTTSDEIYNYRMNSLKEFMSAIPILNKHNSL